MDSQAAVVDVATFAKAYRPISVSLINLFGRFIVEPGLVSDVV